MKKHIIIIIFLLFELNCFCQTQGDTSNSLYGIIYRNISEIKSFKGYTDYGGWVVGNINVGDLKDQKFDYAINHLFGNNKHVLIFEKIIQQAENKVNYQILDTINISNSLLDTTKIIDTLLNEGRFLKGLDCRRDTIYDSSIITIFSFRGDFFDVYCFDKVIKAWYADTRTGRLLPIANTKGINWINDCYHRSCD